MTPPRKGITKNPRRATRNSNGPGWVEGEEGAVTFGAAPELLGEPKQKPAKVQATKDLQTAGEHQTAMYGKKHSVLDLLDRYVLMYGTDTIWDTWLMVPMKSSAFNLAVGRELAKEWNAHVQRRVVGADQIVFDPTGHAGPECINLFQGLKMAPVEGDWADLFELLKHLVSQAADTEQGKQEVLNFVLNWLAYPLQNPGAKMATALVFHGPQGTGKNLFFEAYAKIFGVYATTIGQAQLEGKFNDVFSRKLFILADEVSASNELNHKKNVLKSLITSPVIQIETKFQQARTEANHCNLVFLSNEAKPLALERDDRRHLVIWCPKKRTDDLYQRVRKSFGKGAIEAMYESLLARDLTGFDAHTPPPMTGAKRELVDLGLRPAERFIQEWLNKSIGLPLHPCSNAQLFKAFEKWCRSNNERNLPHQAGFTSTVSKFAGDRLTLKPTAPGTQGSAPIKLWLPAGTGPKDGMAWYEFAQDAVATFAQKLDDYAISLLDA